VDLKEIISSTPDSVNVKISLSSSAVSTFLSIFLSVKQILFSFNHFLAFLLEEEDDFVYTTITNIITPFYSELLFFFPIHFFRKTNMIFIKPFFSFSTSRIVCLCIHDDCQHNHFILFRTASFMSYSLFL